MKKEFSLITIMRKSFDQKPGHRIAAENWLAIRSYGCDEENAVGFHLGIVAPMRKRCL